MNNTYSTAQFRDLIQIFMAQIFLMDYTVRGFNYLYLRVLAHKNGVHIVEILELLVRMFVYLCRIEIPNKSYIQRYSIKYSVIIKFL